MLNLISLQLKLFRNKFIHLRFIDEVIISVMILIGIFFLSWIYWAAWRLLSYLNQVSIIGPLLVNKLLALVFLVSFSMIVFSGLITSFNTIFFSRDLDWLVSTPLSIKKIFSFKLFATSFYASWMVLVALVPFLVALAQVKNASFTFYIGTTALLVPFLILATLCGVIISLLLMRFSPSKETRDIIMFLGVLFLAGLYVLFRFMQPERLVKPDGLEVVSQYISYLDAPTVVWLPSWWITAGIYSLLSLNKPDLFLYSSLLFGLVLVIFIVLVAFAEKLYFVGWAESRVISKRKVKTGYVIDKKPQFLSLLSKDLRIFFRDSNQWSQLLVLGALVIVYLFSIYKLPLDNTLYLKNLVSYANIALIGFILSAVGLRLIFPLISIEGDSAWLLFSAPVSTRKIFWSKLVFGSMPVVLLAVILIVSSNYILKTDFPIFLMTSIATLIMSFGLSTLSMGFGAVFPRFDLANVVQIESSAGGIFYMITALFYIVVNISLWAWPVQNFYRYKFHLTYLSWGHFWWVFLGLIIINGIAFCVPTWLGLRSLQKLEK
ncbi:MAG: hypothetical protein JW871_02460 [Endomicrobiales bacterium]|nr:hypothetical protein [Endomicrobiales bacterium]